MNHWSAIRAAYAAEMPAIMAARALGPKSQTDPYLMDWQFTPIERMAWADIRGRGLPFYPQMPVGRRFVDFGDPHLRIAVELDGKHFHEAATDLARDAELWKLGWRTFRIPGRESLPSDWSPFDPDQDYCVDRHIDWLRTTSEGFFFCLEATYYDADKHLNSKFPGLSSHIKTTLHSHRLLNFPLELGWEIA